MSHSIDRFSRDSVERTAITSRRERRTRRVKPFPLHVRGRLLIARRYSNTRNAIPPRNVIRPSRRYRFYFVRVALPCAPRPPPAPRSHRGHPGRVEKKHYKVARCQLAPLRVARRRRTLHAQTTLHECTCPPPRARSPRRPYRARKTKRGGATPHSRSSHTHRHTVDAQKEPCAAYSGRTRSDDGSPFFVAYFWALVRHALVQARACHPWSKLKAQPLHLPSAVASRPAS